MNLAPSRHPLQLPDSLRLQLLEFRRRVWAIKLIEAAAGAVCGVLVAFLATFVLDRLLDTPAIVRTGLFAAVVLACALVPLALHRWVWRQRKLEQLARLLSRKHPSVGDQLLGVIELVQNEDEQARSLTLCQAAVAQVAEMAHDRDFSDAVPTPRHRSRSMAAGIALALTVLLLAIFPAAAGNAWSRLLAPWGDTPRYTFAMIEPVPDTLIVPHGETFTLSVALAKKSAWQPSQGEVQLGGQRPVTARLRDGRYEFELPGQIDAAPLAIHVGDLTRRTRIEPTLRPELTGIAGTINLPEYLQRPETLHKDVRGGAISLVKGSQASFVATATRDLASADVDGAAVTPQGRGVASPVITIEDTRALSFNWRDQFGLAGKEPFNLNITALDDEPPSIFCDDLPRQRVVLDTETLSFQVKAHDDFGVRRVGMEWQGIESPTVKSPAHGERLLGAGGPDQESLDLAGAFTAVALGIEPQPIRLRLFVEDYLPGRERVYSPAHLFYILNAEQHAIWLTDQLSRWHRQSLEVRDRELQLFETNKALRELSPEQLDQPDIRKRIETQAAAERANGRRLSNLVVGGEELVRQAMRNPEIGVGHLEKWAEMLQILKDISGNRMPSVADLLKQSAQAPQVAANTPSNKAPMAGQNRNPASGSKTTQGDPDQKQPPTAVPKIVDVESSQQPPKKDEEPQPEQKKKPSTPTLRLPNTMLAGNGKPKKQDEQTPTEEKLDEAVAEQQDLLAEFEKIADELNKVLANLEGSTLVKRLKAESRQQYAVAGRLGDDIGENFGTPTASGGRAAEKRVGELSDQEAKSSQNVSNIMDDMQAYFDRRRMANFKSVLDDMRKQDVIGSLRQLGDDLRRETGISMAQCEFWSDTLDRWAEDLVDASNCGQCPGCKSKGSLPPSIVLEVLQILEGEVNLREETRVAEQAKAAVTTEEHTKQAGQLGETQTELRKRVDKVIERIRELPDGEENFAKELRLLGAVSQVMHEATQILQQPNTGAPAIAAETEAIELLLQSKRFNPKKGGGGGASPGGGGGGDTTDSALTLVGSGVNDKELREDRGISQATGKTGDALPEEFRHGLDEYFNKLEKTGGL